MPLDKKKKVSEAYFLQDCWEKECKNKQHSEMFDKDTQQTDLYLIILPGEWGKTAYFTSLKSTFCARQATGTSSLSHSRCLWKCTLPFLLSPAEERQASTSAQEPPAPQHCPYFWREFGALGMAAEREPAESEPAEDWRPRGKTWKTVGCYWWHGQCLAAFENDKGHVSNCCCRLFASGGGVCPLKNLQLWPFESSSITVQDQLPELPRRKAAEWTHEHKEKWRKEKYPFFTMSLS